MTTISDEPRSVTDVAAELAIRAQAYIDGAYVDAASGETFDCVSPIGGEVIATVAACDAADIDRAVAGARATFESGVWSRIAPKRRKQALVRLAQLMDEHAEELALLETIDMGKPIRDARAVDVPKSTECIAWFGEAIDKVYDEIAPTGPEAHVSIVREPLGVVGAVVPWNFPLLMASWKLGPALATGNSVVLKPAEQSPLSVLRLAELATEAGIPDGVLQVVPGFGETAGQALGRHPDVDMIAFTGSTEVGKLFLRYSGESNMKRVALECGGKSPHIVTRRLQLARRRGDRGRVGRLLQPGRGLQRGVAPPRARVGEGRAPREGRRGGRADPARRPAPPEDAHGCDRRPLPARPRARLHRDGEERGRGAPPRREPGPRGLRRLLRRADDLRRRLERHADRAGGDLRPRAVGDLVLGPRRGDRDRERHDLRPLGGGSGRTTSTSPTRRRAPSAPGSSG